MEPFPLINQRLQAKSGNKSMMITSCDLYGDKIFERLIEGGAVGHAVVPLPFMAPIAQGVGAIICRGD
jgi:hypothetical protein